MPAFLSLSGLGEGGTIWQLRPDILARNSIRVGEQRTADLSKSAFFDAVSPPGAVVGKMTFHDAWPEIEKNVARVYGAP